MSSTPAKNPPPPENTLRELTHHAYQGHEELLKQVEQMVEQNTMPALTLFHGPQGMGKRYLLIQVAQHILCHNHPGSITEKNIIAEQIRKAQHPDLWVAPYPGPLAKSHADELQQHLSLQSLRGGARVVVVPEVERFSVARINQLLKLLEEPPHNSYILLSTSRKSAMLPTLLSRCFLWRVPPPSSAAFHRIIKRSYPQHKLTDQQIEELRRSSAGSLSEALFGLEHGEVIKELRSLFMSPLPLKAWSMVDSFKACEALSARELLYAVERVLHQIYTSWAQQEKPPRIPPASLKARRKLLHLQHRALQSADLPLHKGLFLKSLVALYFTPSQQEKL